jgi:2-polyprenyl-6-methoxyphenol hydroxylase-like FAD-dependent oxidoreductase
MFFTGVEVYLANGFSVAEQLGWAPHARCLLRELSQSEPKVVYAPSGRSPRIFGQNWLLVGDSASSYDPLSGRGIFKALHQAKSAAGAIDLALRGDADAMQSYATLVEREFESYRAQRRQFYLDERRWVHHPFWKTRQMEIAH